MDGFGFETAAPDFDVDDAGSTASQDNAKTDSSAQALFEIVGFAKTGGPLTKTISLSLDGKLVSDGSACRMSSGTALRIAFTSDIQFAELIDRLDPHEAIGLGALRSDLPDTVRIVTKRRLSELERNGGADPDVISRTSDMIGYCAGQPALALIDVDTKGMPADIRARVDAAGGFWPAIASAVPGLAMAARVVRNSTSSGISRTDTGEQMPGSAGQHIYIRVQDGADTERFLKTLHERCWLSGFGWLMTGATGQILNRSLVDRMVYAAERLVFEA